MHLVMVFFHYALLLQALAVSSLTEVRLVMTTTTELGVNDVTQDFVEAVLMFDPAATRTRKAL